MLTFPSCPEQTRLDLSPFSPLRSPCTRRATWRGPPCWARCCRPASAAAPCAPAPPPARNASSPHGPRHHSPGHCRHFRYCSRYQDASTDLALVPPPLPPVPAELVPARPLAVTVPAAAGVGSPPVPPLVSPLLPPPPLTPVTVAATAPVASPTPTSGPRPPRASHPLNHSHLMSSFIL